MDLELLLRQNYTFQKVEQIIKFLKQDSVLEYLQKEVSEKIDELEDEANWWENEAEEQEELADERKEKIKELENKIKKLEAK